VVARELAHRARKQLEERCTRQREDVLHLAQQPIDLEAEPVRLGIGVLGDRDEPRLEFAHVAFIPFQEGAMRRTRLIAPAGTREDGLRSAPLPAPIRERDDRLI